MWPNPKLRRSTRAKAGRHAPAPRPIHDPSIITILVGPEELTFRIPEKYAAQSRMFAAASRGQFWAEARTRVMRLPETSTTLFEIFVQGLYHKRLFSANRELEQELRLKFGALASREGDDYLYVLADYLDAQVVRIAAVDAMILRHEKSDLMTFYDIDSAFANTSPDSKLRELLVHITTYDLDMGSTAREDLIGMPNEFPVDADAVPAHFREPQDGPPWQTLNTCYYHEHSTEEGERDCAARVAREKVLERREQDRNRG
ncbi:hypothetical protein D6C82_02096 [Aureobasidium pullulans]|nr:hypothetical protein D6C82_02096 [Aureobasidium pullulans]